MWNSKIMKQRDFPMSLVRNYFHFLIIKQHFVPTPSTTTKMGVLFTHRFVYNSVKNLHKNQEKLHFLDGSLIEYLLS
jgi:hypothetical protein